MRHRTRASVRREPLAKSIRSIRVLSIVAASRAPSGDHDGSNASPAPVGTWSIAPVARSITCSP